MNNTDSELFIKLKELLYKRVSMTNVYVDEEWYIYIVNKNEIDPKSVGKRIECYINKNGDLEYYKEENGELGELFFAGDKIDDFKWIVKKVLYGNPRYLWDGKLKNRLKQHPLLNAREKWMERIYYANYLPNA